MFLDTFFAIYWLIIDYYCLFYGMCDVCDICDVCAGIAYMLFYSMLYAYYCSSLGYGYI